MVQAYCSGYTTLPNKEGSWVLGLQGSVAKILQNPLLYDYYSANRCSDHTMRVWFYNNGGIGLLCLHSHYNLDFAF